MPAEQEVVDDLQGRVLLHRGFEVGLDADFLAVDDVALEVLLDGQVGDFGFLRHFLAGGEQADEAFERVAGFAAVVDEVEGGLPSVRR